ncbi:MAG: universal stress protein [Planctomycetales bacterium]|nr:universal stress protein [Planctomycetales bacterium]
MRQFKRILAGVDLASGDRLVAEELTEANEEAVGRAIWLAQRNDAELTFQYCLDVSPKAEAMLRQSGEHHADVLRSADEGLALLVERARAEGVDADFHVVFGRSWLELIHQVERGQHDLLIVGTRRLGKIEGVLLGSTGVKLLRYCPCPVWVTKPLNGRKFDSILVAHDMRPVGELALRLGCGLASFDHAQLHVLHAAEIPELEGMPWGVDVDATVAVHRRTIERVLWAQLGEHHLPLPPQLHYSLLPADEAILNAIEKYAVDVAVMGTLGRTGIPGLMVGNTAERLLPRIDCSVLAIKPTDFRSPVPSKPV